MDSMGVCLPWLGCNQKWEENNVEFTVNSKCTLTQTAQDC